MASEGVRRLRVLGLLVCVATLLGAASPELLERGRKLFAGEAPLTGRMVGHEQALPPEVVRCSNCHQREAAGSAPASTKDFGPKLGALGLTRALPRRGGPPSSYNWGSFCRLLRDGIDPAYVMIPQTMPRYTLSDAECEAMWSYLITP
jgi:hypothetical protein